MLGDEAGEVSRGHNTQGLAGIWTSHRRARGRAHTHTDSCQVPTPVLVSSWYPQDAGLSPATESQRRRRDAVSACQVPPLCPPCKPRERGPQGRMK